MDNLEKPTVELTALLVVAEYRLLRYVVFARFVVWEGRVSTVTAINMNKQTVTIEVDMFGRETSVEIGFLDVKKL